MVKHINSTLEGLENGRRPYRQLSLIEDAIVIYRLVRAPERLVFNVDVGNMAPPKAEAYLRKLIQNYWSSENQKKLKLQHEIINATYSWDVRAAEWKKFFNEARELKA